MLTQLLVMCKDEAFARMYIQYPFVATTIKTKDKPQYQRISISYEKSNETPLTWKGE